MSAHVAQWMSAGLRTRTGGGSPVRDASVARYLLPTGMACGQWQWVHIHIGQVRSVSGADRAQALGHVKLWV